MANSFFSADSTFFPSGGGGGAAQLRWVALNITTVTEVDPNGLVSATAFNAGTGVCSITYDNGSAAVLDGTGEGASWVFPIESILPGIDLDAGDIFLYRVTAIANTAEWRQFTAAVGMRNTTSSSASAAGLNGTTGTVYRTAHMTNTASTYGTTITTNLGASELVGTGSQQWAAGNFTNAINGVVRAMMVDETSNLIPVSYVATGALATNPIVVSVGTSDAVSYGGLVAQVRFEVARVPYPRTK